MRTQHWTKWRLLAAAVVIVGCSSPSPMEAPPLEAPTALVAAATTAQRQASPGESIVLIYPDDLLIYWSYLDVIGGEPRAADTLVIEATLTSLNAAEVCPYQEELCSIEPYPSHWGVVRIDRIVSYAAYADQGQQPAVDQSGEAQSREFGEAESRASGEAESRASGEAESRAVGEAESPPGLTTPGYTGSEQQPEVGSFRPLEVGQQVEAIFLLTAGPVKVRYVPMLEAKQAQPMAPSGEDSQQTAAHPAQPGRTVFRPIPREGGSLVFTTRMGDYEGAVEKGLPGLQVGSTFRAQVKYDGILYVEEYEVMP